MKLVINRCFGGFGLSKKATKRLAELQGRPCYFFVHTYTDGAEYAPIDADDSVTSMFWTAFDTPNPNDSSFDYSKHVIDNCRDYDQRGDKNLVRVVEELGKDANGDCAELAVIEVPDKTPWDIEDYDGVETVHEVHRFWG